MQTEVHLIDGAGGRRIYLGKAFPGVYFTVREAELAQLLADFKYREIACLMNISRRTAEYYAFNMKKKLRCETKTQMTEILNNFGIVNKIKKVVDVTYLFSEDSQTFKGAA